jgi:hypothetical protein
MNWKGFGRNRMSSNRGTTPHIFQDWEKPLKASVTIAFTPTEMRNKHLSVWIYSMTATMKLSVTVSRQVELCSKGLRTQTNNKPATDTSVSFNQFSCVFPSEVPVTLGVTHQYRPIPALTYIYSTSPRATVKTMNQSMEPSFSWEIYSCSAG